MKTGVCAAPRAAIVAVLALTGGCGWFLDSVEDNNPLFGQLVRGGRAAYELTPDTDATVREVSGRIYKAMLAEHGGAVQDAALTGYIGRIGARVLGATTPRKMPLRYTVVASERPWAASTPQGDILMSVGALRALRSEAELAALIAHEGAHIRRDHGMTRYRRHRARKVMGESRNAAVAIFSRAAFAAYLSAEVTASLPHEQELEADADAVKIVTRAGYDAAATGSLVAPWRTVLTDAGHSTAAGKQAWASRTAALRKHTRSTPGAAAERPQQDDFHSAMRAFEARHAPPAAAPTPPTPPPSGAPGRPGS